MLWSLLVFPRVVKRLGARSCALLGLYVSSLVPMALGSVSFLAGAHVPHGGILGALVIVQVVKACSQQLCFPTAMVRSPQPASLLSQPASAVCPDSYQSCVAAASAGCSTQTCCGRDAPRCPGQSVVQSYPTIMYAACS